MIVPLGKTVSSVLRVLSDEGLIPPSPCLFGFPHPSGANGHRRTEFAANERQMREDVAAAFDEAEGRTF